MNTKANMKPYNKSIFFIYWNIYLMIKFKNNSNNDNLIRFVLMIQSILYSCLIYIYW